MPQLPRLRHLSTAAESTYEPTTNAESRRRGTGRGARRAVSNQSSSQIPCDVRTAQAHAGRCKEGGRVRACRRKGEAVDTVVGLCWPRPPGSHADASGSPIGRAR